MESGKGVVGKLFYDDAYAESLTASMGSAAKSLESVTAKIEHGFETNDGIVPALMNDPVSKQKVYELIENLRVTSTNLAAFSASMQTGEGIVPRLLNDKAYGDQALGEFSMLVHQLNEIVGKINTGNGSAGKLINDPAVYESINDILIGINESKLLRWLVRNRQQTGIERRYEEQQKAPEVPPPPAVETPPVVEPPPPTVTDTTGTTATTDTTGTQ
jgi:hypothetical protein